MAHQLSPAGNAAPALTRNIDLETDDIRRARTDLAACLRMAAHLGLEEGVCNHFSALVPGHPDLFLVNRLGWSFHEATASNLLICDFDGNVVSGDGEPEATAFYIHARLHKMAPHIARMRELIADDLQVTLDQVNVKATTTEKLGFTGREEGIAVHAVALLLAHD